MPRVRGGRKAGAAYARLLFENDDRGAEACSMNVGLTLLLSVIALAVIMIASCFYFMFWMKKSTFNNVNDLDEIRSTGLPPERWQKRYLEKCRKLGRIPPELFEKQKKRDLRRLRRLTRFCRTTVLMESDEVRRDVLQELSQCRQEWEARGPEDL